MKEVVVAAKEEVKAENTEPVAKDTEPATVVPEKADEVTTAETKAEPVVAAPLEEIKAEEKPVVTAAPAEEARPEEEIKPEAPKENWKNKYI